MNVIILVFFLVSILSSIVGSICGICGGGGNWKSPEGLVELS